MTNRINILSVMMLVIFLPAFLMQTWRLPLVYAWHYLNKESITKQFCSNRDKPELMCSGKCHVLKIIKKYDTSGEDWLGLLPKPISKLTLTLIKNNCSPDLSLIDGSQFVTASFLYLFNYSLTMSKLVFRPPQTLS